MRHPLTPLQQAITFRTNSFGSLFEGRLRENLAAEFRRPDCSEQHWLEDFSLAIDLLALYGVLRIERDAAGARRLVSLQPRPAPVNPAVHGLPSLPKRGLRLSWPLTVATTGTLLVAGCSLFPVSSGTGDVVAYGDGTSAPARIEQFRVRDNMVYRYCQGDECPSPTPKRLAVGGLAYATAATATAPAAATTAVAGSTTSPRSTQATIAQALQAIARGAKEEAPTTPAPAPLCALAETTQRASNGKPPVLLAMANASAQTAHTLIEPAQAGTPSAESAEPAEPAGRLKLDPKFTSYQGIVEFANGSQVLDGLSKQKIAEIAPQAREAESVRVRGRVARESLDEEMKKLAVGRAYAVKMELAKYNVAKDKIRILNPKADLLDSSNRQSSANRSVDIYLDMPQQAKGEGPQVQVQAQAPIN